ncbi:hypothetical protein IV203_000260 [Nitzschia inconspicua]|uniref:Uncharacterized protein n=1 Tax=Nitzschia inconspicua TaxID=303405 RepID=A0A9K3PSB2_9STRA|nr:hypothetical protein IV203_000260 [Nitzschia inconspicua]
MTFHRRCTYTVAILVVAFGVLLSSVSTVVFVVGQLQQQQAYSMEELQSMSEKQLEDICIQRGFELLKDEVNATTGELYELTHQDYVEAAMKCLAIEQEMNELLSQYPELAEELEEEIKKMEAENAAKQAELEEMQSKLSGAKQPQGSTDGAAFVSKSDAGANREGSTVNNRTTIDNSPVDTDDLEISEDSDIDQIHHDDEVVEEIREESSNETMETEKSETTSTATTTTEVANLSAGSSSHKEDFTLSHLAIESLRAFVKHAKDDVKRILELVVPVMQPLLTAGDVAWRQIKALFVKARDAYYETGATNQSGEENNPAPEKDTSDAVTEEK